MEATVKTMLNELVRDLTAIPPRPKSEVRRRILDFARAVKETGSDLDYHSDPTPEYPEHEKLQKVKDKSQTCGEFLEWLTGEKNFVLAKYHDHDDSCPEGCSRDDYLYPMHPGIPNLLHEFFEIDARKLEEEKRAMLEAIRTGVK